MIKSLFILGFAACLTGISLCDKDFGFRSTAYDNFDVYDEYKGSFRMQYGDYDPSDGNEDQAKLNRNDAVESNPTSETLKDTEEEHPPYNATNAANLLNSKIGAATNLLANNKQKNATKVPANNKPNNATKMPANNNKPNNPTKTNQTSSKVKSKPTNSKQTTNVKPAKILPHGPVTKLPNGFKVISKKRFVTIQYYLYKKDDYNLYVLKHLPRLRPNKEVFFMLHGSLESKDASQQQEEYVRQFYNSVSSAILPQCDCTVIGVKWSFVKPHQPKPFIEYRAAIIAGRKLGNAINELRSSGGFRAHLSIISHDLGNVAAASLATVLKRPVDYIYGLDQRPLPGNYKNFYLREDSGELVQTITTNDMKYNYGHRNFYPNGGNLSLAFDCEDQCFFCHSFRLLSDDITQNSHDHASTFCSSYDDYISNCCRNMPQVSYFNRIPASQLPTGNYFITEVLQPPQPYQPPNDNDYGDDEIWRQ